MNDQRIIGGLIVLLFVGLLILIIDRRRKQAAIQSAPRPEKTPEQAKADRIAREERERQLAVEQFAAARAQSSGWLQILGALLMMIAFWFLIVDPGIESSVVNLQKLYIGQTAGIVGAVFICTGVLLKYLG